MERDVAAGGDDARGALAEVAAQRFHAEIVAHQPAVEADPAADDVADDVGDRLAGSSASQAV